MTDYYTEHTVDANGFVGIMAYDDNTSDEVVVAKVHSKTGEIKYCCDTVPAALKKYCEYQSLSTQFEARGINKNFCYIVKDGSGQFQAGPPTPMLIEAGGFTSVEAYKEDGCWRLRDDNYDPKGTEYTMVTVVPNPLDKLHEELFAL